MKLLPVTTAALLCAASPLFAEDIDACFVGTWAADLEDLSHIYADQMAATSATARGEVIMTIQTDGHAEILVDDLSFHVVIPDTPEMDVSLQGSTQYALSANDGAFVASVEDYAYVARADVLGTVMEIPISAADGLFGGALGAYGCTPDSISFENTGDTPKMPRHWTRIAG